MKPMSYKQREVLRLLANGYSISEIAHQLQVSRSTVDKNLYVAKKKLKARSTIEAVYTAVKCGILLLCLVATNLREYEELRRVKFYDRVVTVRTGRRRSDCED